MVKGFSSWNTRKVYDLNGTNSSQNINDLINFDQTKSQIFSLLDLVNFLPEQNWNSSKLSANPNISEAEILSDLELLQDFSLKLGNPNLTLNIIQELVEANPYLDSTAITLHPNISFEQIKAHPEIPWSPRFLSCRSDLEIEHVLENLSLDWDWVKLSQVQDLKVIEAHPKLPWVDSGLTQNRTLSLEKAKKIYTNSNRESYQKNISQFINFDEVLRDFKGPVGERFKWNFKYLSLNSTLTTDFVLEHWDIGWNFENLAKNPNINPEIIFTDSIKNKYADRYQVLFLSQRTDVKKDFLDLLIRTGHEIDFSTVYRNHILSLDEIRQNPSKYPNQLKYLILHPEFQIRDLKDEKINFADVDLSLMYNLSYDFIYYNKDLKWNWERLSGHKFPWEKKRKETVLWLEDFILWRKMRRIEKFLDIYLIADLTDIITVYLLPKRE